MHTTWSDGKATVLEMAEAARALGYDYIAICDHTRNVRVVPGLDADDLRRQAEEIAAANEQLAPFRVLRGSECDILADGSLDLPDDVLAELDWVQASVHAGQRQSREQLTKRTLAAVAAPGRRARSAIRRAGSSTTGRRTPSTSRRCSPRAPRTARRSRRTGCRTASISSSELVRDAIRAGVLITCSTDAHSVRGLANMQLAVATARRGWATGADVLNTRPLSRGQLC